MTNSQGVRTEPARPAWVDVVLTAHNSVAPGHVSHAGRMKSDRYFVWMEDEEDDLSADNIHAEHAVSGTTDLFTKREFDPWAAAIGAAFDAAGMWWEKTGTTYEEDTGFFHHSWDWTVAY